LKGGKNRKSELNTRVSTEERRGTTRDCGDKTIERRQGGLYNTHYKIRRSNRMGREKGERLRKNLGKGEMWPYAG